MELNFLFLDECQSDLVDRAGTHISSLTGLLVPAASYAELRTRFYGVLGWAVQPGPGVIDLSPPELHGRDLLRGEDDERKLAVLSEMVDLVVDGGIRIYRVGYYITRQVKSVFAADPKLLGLCWNGVLVVLQPVLARQAVVPVMDMGDRDLVRALSGQVRTMDVIRATGYGQTLSISHTENLLGEVFYADSEHSVFTQTADLVSYLRHTNDMNREGRRLSPFRCRLLELAQALEPAVVHDQVVRLRFPDQI
ncbi:MAG TPA: hypothetical protein VFQ76_12425 [Longimicrobiaceae bacterium]|nr:hypothetical protein [Longimicrobiaceae bacterium]